MKRKLILGALLATCLLRANAAGDNVDPNFHIYLCFGQSNMEGNAQWESMDTKVDPRFKMLATTNFTKPQRTMGMWYAAVPPIVSPIGKLGMADYFGRTMLAAMPDNVRIGVVDVAIGGCAIQMFDKTNYKAQVSNGNYSASLANQFYGGNPYKRLVDMAKKAMESGVIKGILLHQGETNNSDPNWPNMVKKIYEDLLNDLGLKATDVPLFAGETLRQEYGGVCWGHNAQVGRLHSVIPTAYAIHSNGCDGNHVDPWHFCAKGYRTMGKRYAYKMLKYWKQPTMIHDSYRTRINDYPDLKNFFTLKGEPVIKIIGTGTRTLQLWATFADGHEEDLTEEAKFASDDVKISSGKISYNQPKVGVVSATYTDFFGDDHTVYYNLDGTVSAIHQVAASGIRPPSVYSLDGCRQDTGQLKPGIYISEGKKIIIK
jgi:hypothetical protein